MDKRNYSLYTGLVIDKILRNKNALGKFGKSLRDHYRPNFAVDTFHCIVNEERKKIADGRTRVQPFHYRVIYCAFRIVTSVLVFNYSNGMSYGT